MRSSFQLPQYDQDVWQFKFNHAVFGINNIKYKSPTLPLHFDKAYLPSIPFLQSENLCEKELLNASECLLNYNFRSTSKEQMCGLELSHYQICRRHRDIRILKGIYEWQMKHVASLDKQNREMYKMGLGRKLERLENDYSRQTSTINGITKAKEL